MAKKRRKARRSSNPRRHAVARVHHRRRRNPMVMANRRRVHHRRRRNPMGYGSKSLVETSLGALIGVSAVRVLPAMIPSQITSAIPVTPFTGAAINAAITFAAWTVANKFAPKDVANGVAIGGGAIVLSQLWSALGLPAPPGFGISGIGDIVATQGFAVPDRSMRAPVIPMPVASGGGVSGYGSGGYRRMIR